MISHKRLMREEGVTAEDVAEFRASPAAQDELRSFMAGQGARLGQQLSDDVCRLPPKCLLSNSGRTQAAAIVSRAIADQSKRHKGLGYDERNIAIFAEAARGELRWLGV